MRFKIFGFTLLAALLAGVSVGAQAQDEEEMTRGAFLTSRPPAASVSAGVSTGGRTGAVSASASNSSATSTTTRRRRRPPVRSNTSRTTASKSTTSAGVGSKTTATKSNTGTTTTATVAVSSAPIGLGYTLYMRDANGDAVRVDPERQFRTGDRVRVSLETNTDGYLYIFNTTDNGDPVMIFPDAQLDEGGNYVEAHVPYEVPASTGAEERLRWFAFDAKPGTERLYIVVTREPIPGVPIEDDLVDYCRQNQNRCPWRPSGQMWAQVRAGMNAQAKVVKSKTYGQVQTGGEREATTRGLGLSQSEPPPSVIRINVSSNTGVLVTALDLIHR
ncbi:MAG TPA: DUF4384 domain-containing protein [Pyrinomonadaceae bacterium]|jgi:hypothetical protein|nr:DUF4384 domain-containing protein [Pyrinomonadaceae bacterium]